MRAIGKIVKKFKETRVVTNIVMPVYHYFARSAENIAVLSESVAEDPNVSIPPLWPILHLDVHLYPNKVQLTQQQNPAEHSQCRRYME